MLFELIEKDCVLPGELCLSNGQGYWFDAGNHRVMSRFLNSPITTDEIQVDNLSFYVNPSPGEVMSANKPTRVTILATVSRQGAHGSSDQMQVQTTVTLRQY